MAENISSAVTPRNVKASIPKMSFASVAAMPPKSIDKQKKPKVEEKASETPVKGSPNLVQTNPPISANPTKLDPQVGESLSKLEIKEALEAVPDVPDQDVQATLQIDPRLDDEKTHLSLSSTKAASVDGKSVTSGTTFAMDEKESIRPDDSASVQAAEDDDSNSGPGTGEPSSRLGSESGAKPFQYQFHEISERTGGNTYRPTPLSRRVMLSVGEDSRPGILPASNLPSTTGPDVGAEIGVAGIPQLPAMVQEPDEKLLEALESPKDRLFLLQLEQQFISFIRDSQENTLDLPPCNSFCRLLAHRLGDYYQLLHFVDNSVSAVRLYKNPNSHLPAPLSTYSRSTVTSDDPPAVVPSMKIMRRAGVGTDTPASGSVENTAASSLDPSKPNSDAGDESQEASGMVSPTESTIAKDKAAQSREEREAKYKEARDRIFADYKEGEAAESGQNNTTSNEASRASSTTGKKKKKNKQYDDGFQARSAYIASYDVRRPGSMYDQHAAMQMGYYSTPMQQSAGPMAQQGYYPTMNAQFQTMPQMQGYQMPMQPQNQMQMASAIYPQQGLQRGLQQQFMQYQQPPQISGSYYPSMQSNQMAPQSSAISSPSLSSNNAQPSRPQSQMSDQNWGQLGYQGQFHGYNGAQNPYQQHNQPQMQAQSQPVTPVPPNPQMQLGIPYAYGQLPFQPNSHGSRTAHPVPGSYNRQNFNPQTRSFVPSTSSLSASANSYSNQPTSHSGYSGAASGPTSVPQQQPHHQPQMPFSLNPQFSPNVPAQIPTTPRKSSQQVPRSQSPGQSTISKWGTPSNLPPKPPPPAPQTGGSPNGALMPNVPTFQNGTYFIPGGSLQDRQAP